MHQEILKTVILDRPGIEIALPHRDPLLLIDLVHQVEFNKSIICSKKLLGTEPVFQGHFPGNPLYPGVYYVESVAQAGAILGLLTRRNDGSEGQKVLGVLASIDSARFKKSGVPGDTLVFDVKITKNRGLFYWFHGDVYVGNDLIASTGLSIAFSLA